MIQMTQIARTAIFKIIEEEGGWQYTNHPTDIDRGTYAGVRYQTFRNYIIGRVDTKDDVVLTPEEFKTAAKNGLLKDMIMDIYYVEYYKKLQIDKLVDLMKMPVLSCGVNCGTRRGGLILQRTINAVVGPSNVKVDGIIGTKTLDALDRLVYAPIFFSHNYASNLEMDIKLQGLVNIDKFRNNFIKFWLQRYVNITVDKPEYVVFLAGWFNRANRYWLY